jgi:hypothetical protein
MKSIWLVVSWCIFSLVSGFSPFTDQNYLESIFRVREHGITHPRGSEQDNEEDYISYQLHYLFHQDGRPQNNKNKIVSNKQLTFGSHLRWVDVEKDDDDDQEQDDEVEYVVDTTTDGKIDDTDEQSLSASSVVDSSVMTTTCEEKLIKVNEIKEATNLDRRMHALGMISVHCEMEMLKFK